MIEFLRGRISSKQPTRLIIDVGGVGMGVDVSLRAGEKAGNVGESAELLTYLHVREDALDLYGFADAAEKFMFLKLLSVSGIGPKLALRILSAVGPREMADHIRRGDVKGLTALKGVGKKTAEVLIATLRNSVEKMDLAPLEDSGGVPVENGPMRDAVMALITLGVKDMQAQEAVMKAAKKLGDKVDASRLIAQALQEV